MFILIQLSEMHGVGNHKKKFSFCVFDLWVLWFLSKGGRARALSSEYKSEDQAGFI